MTEILTCQCAMLTQSTNPNRIGPVVVQFQCKNFGTEVVMPGVGEIANLDEGRSVDRNDRNESASNIKITSMNNVMYVLGASVALHLDVCYMTDDVPQNPGG